MDLRSATGPDVAYVERRNAARHRVVYAAAFGLFLVSGFCALLYQILWTRLAFAHFGIVTPVLSAILSVFMLGIGVGAALGGRLADGARRFGVDPIFVYAACELAVAVGAFAVPASFDWGANVLLGAGVASSALYLTLSGCFIAVTVLPWTIAMGATIPLMMSYVRAFGAGESSFGLLYRANVIGGALGALAEAFVLIELCGIRGTWTAGSVCNVMNAVAAVALGFLVRPPSPKLLLPGRSHAGASKRAGGGFTRAILFTTGFCSLALEVAWTRDFTFSLLTTIYAFAAILATYLCATAIGAWIYQRSAKNAGSIDEILAGLFASALLPVLLTDPRLGPSPVLTLASIVPFCGLLGYLTPRLVDDASDGDPACTGKHYAINVAGCILGPLAAGYVLLPALGLRATMIALTLPFLALYLVRALYAKAHGATIAAAGCALFVACAGYSRAYDDVSLYRAPVEVRRDYVASVVASGTGMDRTLTVNSVGITFLSTVTKAMAHLPLALHPTARTALDICFGMGTTFRSLLSWGIDTTAVDLSPSVLGSFAFFHSDAKSLATLRRGALVVDDGRRYLTRTRRRFDVVTIDPPPPVEAAGSSLLYSEQFYNVLKRRLNDDGIVQQWIPLTQGPTLQSVALALADFVSVRAGFSSDGTARARVRRDDVYSVPATDFAFDAGCFRHCDAGGRAPRFDGMGAPRNHCGRSSTYSQWRSCRRFTAAFASFGSPAGIRRPALQRVFFSAEEWIARRSNGTLR